MVYDCYRPQRAVDDFVAWARDGAGAATDPLHHPVVPRSELFPRGYIAARSGHSRGSTVDLTLIPAGATPAAARDSSRATAGPMAGAAGAGREPDMGTTFDCFDERAHAADAARRRRRGATALLLRAVMEKHGFVAYAQEWWHFTLASEPFPKTAFDFEIQRAP